jgi:very-short-patch-repair endonuclease
VHLVDAFLATPLVGRQHGAVSVVQLRAEGAGRGAIARGVERGLLHRVHRGVYAVGHPRLPYKGRLWAAVLATDGVLSHRSAAAEWDLLPRPRGSVDVITTGGSRSQAGIRVHRTTTLDPLNDVVRDDDGLPRTTVARTLIDLADVLKPKELERVCERAELLRIMDAVKLAGRRRLPVTSQPALTRSELERRFLRLVRRARLPKPSVNAFVEGQEVDFAWWAHKLAAETDGAAAHLTKAAFERDRRRDAALLRAGWRVVRFTYRQVVHEPEYVADTLKRLL